MAAPAVVGRTCRMHRLAPSWQTVRLLYRVAEIGVGGLGQIRLVDFLLLGRSHWRFFPPNGARLLLLRGQLRIFFMQLTNELGDFRFVFLQFHVNAICKVGNTKIYTSL